MDGCLEEACAAEERVIGVVRHRGRRVLVYVVTEHLPDSSFFRCDSSKKRSKYKSKCKCMCKCKCTGKCRGKCRGKCWCKCR